MTRLPPIRRRTAALRLAAAGLAAAALGTLLAGAARAADEDDESAYGTAEGNGGALPLWEAGVFLGAARIPDYRGSDEYNRYVVPIPYAIYRGERVAVSREGFRGHVLRRPRFGVDLSLFGHPPVSRDNRARAGMDERDALLEAGPVAKWYLNGREAQDPLLLMAAVRAVGSFGWDDGLDAGYAGLHGALTLRQTNRSWFPRQRLRFTVALTAEATDRRYNGYFYDVPEADATPGRPAYRCEGGYAGASLAASITKRLTRALTVGSFVRWEHLGGAAFADSPLVRETDYVLGGVAVIWRALASQQAAGESSK